MDYVLLVAWLLGGTSVSSYSTDFGSLDLCMAAKGQLEREAQRHVDEQMARIGTKTASGATIVGPGPTPFLLATCAKKK